MGEETTEDEKHTFLEAGKKAGGRVGSRAENVEH